LYVSIWLFVCNVLIIRASSVLVKAFPCLIYRFLILHFIEKLHCRHKHQYQIINSSILNANVSQDFNVKLAFFSENYSFSKALKIKRRIRCEIDKD